MMIDNPFVSNADSVNTKHFIGRKQEIQGKIKRAVFAHESPLNLSIIGIPNIGKTSLINNAVLVHKDDLKKRGVYPIVLDFSTIPNPLTFFRLLAKNTLKHLKENNLYQDKVHGIEDLVTTEITEENFLGNITDFFETVEKTRDFHALFILDRFDHAKSVLNELVYLNLLRNLASKSCLSFLVLSCRSITDIEEGITGSFSPFGKSFEAPLRLEMFCDDDVDIYFKKYEDIGISISKADKQSILFYCGGHPYLLQSLGHKIVDMYSTTEEINVDAAAAAISEEDVFSSYYHRLITFLKDVKRYSPLYQILSGTLTSIDSDATDAKTELKKYGLISETKTGTYIAYSGHFHNYLSELYQDSAKFFSRSTSAPEPLDLNHHADKSVEESVKELVNEVNEALKNLTLVAAVSTATDADYKPETSLGDLWEGTEIALRKLIVTIMSDNYGEGWFESLKDKNSLLEGVFERCRNNLSRTTRDLPGVNRVPLFNFANQTDLFSIILDNTLWDQYFHNFLENRFQWELYGKFMIPCRHLIKHSNAKETLTELQSGMFRLCCKDILETLEKVKVRISTTDENSPQVQGEEEPREPNQTVVSANTPTTDFQTSVPTGTQRGVVYFINQRGWGRITPNTCDSDHHGGIFVHVSKFPIPGQLDSLQTGQRVEFTIEETSDGWNAHEVVVID